MIVTQVPVSQEVSVTISCQCLHSLRMKQSLWWLTRIRDIGFTSTISFCVSITFHLMWVVGHLNVFPVFHTIYRMFSVWPNPKCISAKLLHLQSVYIWKKIWAICFSFIGFTIQKFSLVETKCKKSFKSPLKPSLPLSEVTHNEGVTESKPFQNPSFLQNTFCTSLGSHTWVLVDKWVQEGHKWTTDTNYLLSLHA
jgi:hypothetical protein